MKIFQKGFNYSQDGPGNRLVFHLQGCNMRCPWCANPEGFRREGTLMTDEKWLDAALCPHGAIGESGLDRSLCGKCGDHACVRTHRGKGVRHSCEEVEAENLLEEILSARMMYWDGGGVTFTGGECTLQFEELLEILKLLKEQGIHTAVESNGAHLKLEELFPYIDHLMVDCKMMDEERHQKLTGISNRIILDNIRKAARTHPSVHVRVPLIGGVNSQPEEMEALTAFFQSLPQKNITFEILKYHEYGKKKWQQCGLDYRMDETAKVTKEEVCMFREKMQSAGLKYKCT